MPAEISTLMKEPEFQIKLTNFLASIIGLYHWALFASFKCPVENAIMYAALTGGIASSLALLTSFYQEDRNRLFEDMLQGIYALLNIMTAYIAFQKIKICFCYSTILNPVIVVFVTSLICATSMTYDIIHRMKAAA